MFVNKPPDYFNRRSSSAWAKKALASFRISLARCNSFTSRSSSLTRSRNTHPQRRILATVFLHHPHGALSHFRGKLVLLLHSSILSEVEASTKPGAVHRRQSCALWSAYQHVVVKIPLQRELCERNGTAQQLLNHLPLHLFAEMTSWQLPVAVTRCQSTHRSPSIVSGNLFSGSDSSGQDGTDRAVTPLRSDARAQDGFTGRIPFTLAQRCRFERGRPFHCTK